MPGAQEVDAEREDYVVSIVEFAGDTQRALNALQRLFALREEDARAILGEAPVAVRRGVNRIRAEYFRRALSLAGARVEVRDGDGQLVHAEVPAEPRSAQRPGPRPQPSAPRAAPLPPAASDAAVPGSPLTAAAPVLRESARAVYEAIPAGERWKAPSAEAVAKVHRKQLVHGLESGLGDIRPSPRPPGMPAPEARPALIPGATAPATRQPLSIATDTELGFWQVMRLPLAGSGLARIFVIITGAAGLGLIAKLGERLPWLAAPLFLLMLCPVLAICAEYQRSAFWAAATGESELEASSPVPVAEMMRSGLYATGLAAVTHVLLWVWLVNQLLAGKTALSIVCSSALWVLSFGPGFYWPIALGCAAAGNHMRGVWDIGQGLRALGRGPLAIAQAALASGCVFAVSLVLSTAVLSALQLGPAFTICAASGLPLALSHGLMGAWLGRALRSQPELFE